MPSWLTFPPVSVTRYWMVLTPCALIVAVPAAPVLVHVCPPLSEYWRVEIAPFGPLRSAIDGGAIVPASSTLRVVVGALGERAEVLGAAATQLRRAPEILAARLP